MLSVTWAVNIWSEVPEYPLFFPLFPTLLQNSTRCRKQEMVPIWYIERTTEEEAILAERWFFLFFTWSLHTLHTLCLVWKSPLAQTPDTQGCGPYTELSFILPSPLVPAGASLAVGTYMQRELGTRALQSICRLKSLGFPRNSSYKPGAGIILCTELRSLRWKGSQINGVTGAMAPSAPALYQ